MGISVPISAEQYKTLKIISDKLGLGLKKTMEYLVIYYSEREIQSSSLKDDIEPIKEIIGLEKEIHLTSSKVNPITEMTKKEDGETHYVRSKIDLGSQMTCFACGSKSTLFFDEESSTSSCLEKEQSIESLIPESKTNGDNCFACGVPKRENASYCYNCGNLIRL